MNLLRKLISCLLAKFNKHLTPDEITERCGHIDTEILTKARNK